MSPTVQDIPDAAYGATTPEGPSVEAALDRLITKAEARLLVAVPSIAVRLAAGTPDASLVAGVIEDMVLRIVRNPNGLRSVSIDDYQATVDRALSSGELYVSDAEVALLSPVVSPTRRVGSIRIGVPEWRLPCV